MTRNHRQAGSEFPTIPRGVERSLRFLLQPFYLWKPWLQQRNMRTKYNDYIILFWKYLVQKGLFWGCGPRNFTGVWFKKNPLQLILLLILHSFVGNSLEQSRFLSKLLLFSSSFYGLTGFDSWKFLLNIVFFFFFLRGKLVGQ